MPALGNTAAVRILEHLTGKSSHAAPVSTYILLYNEPPTAEGGGSPVDEAPPQQIRWATPNLNPATIANSNTIIWTDAGSEWGEIGGWAVVDAQTGAANILFFGIFADPQIINIGDDFQIDPGDVTLTIS